MPNVGYDAVYFMMSQMQDHEYMLYNCSPSHDAIHSMVLKPAMFMANTLLQGLATKTTNLNELDVTWPACSLANLDKAISGVRKLFALLSSSTG